MDFSKLTDGFGSLKDGLGEDLTGLGEKVFEGKESFSDALNEEKDTMFGKVKGLFGGDDEHKTDEDASKDDDSSNDDDSK